MEWSTFIWMFIVAIILAIFGPDIDIDSPNRCSKCGCDGDCHRKESRGNGIYHAWSVKLIIN